mgnify:CR=1 FL=1
METILFIVALIAFAVWFSHYKTKKAVEDVIKRFRKHDALDEETAKTRKELDLLSLQEKGFLNRIMQPRDYKVHIFDLFLQLNIIRQTGDGRFYMSEKTLESSDLKYKI